MYECSICLSLNSNEKHHCQYCGTIPKQYSVLGKPCRLIEHHGRSVFIEVKALPSSQRMSKQGQIKLHTMPLDYYAE